MIRLNYTYAIFFSATVDGVGTAADETPIAVLWRNGSASGVPVTVSTTAQTGWYKAVFTTDAGWSASDLLEMSATATLAGTAGYLAKVWSSTEFAAVPADVSPTIDFTPTINPTELSAGDITAIRVGLPSVAAGAEGGLPVLSADLTVIAELDSASRAAILTQELIESYAADGAAPTVAQALMMILQHHQQKSVSGTTVTIKKLDKSTTAGTYTLDSATDPSSITRAT